MRIEIKGEINRASLRNMPYTTYRPFYDGQERSGLEKCHCGKPSLVISYCTLMDARVVLCRECLQKYREEVARSR